jgi:acyl-CoA thioesterase FadM
MMLTDQKLTFDNGVFVFETVMRVRNTEIDVGQYLTLEALTGLLAEARARFLYSKGIKEVNADYQGLIIDNLQLNILSRVRAREELLFEVGVEQLSNEGGEMAVKITRMHDNSAVAMARQHFVNYDYRLNKVTTLNSMLKEALSPQPFEL